MRCAFEECAIRQVIVNSTAECSRHIGGHRRRSERRPVPQSELRAAGYEGRLVSVEPLATAFGELARRAGRDPLWIAVHAAAGARQGIAEINLAANSVSSSLLAMLPRHLAAAPDSEYVGQESISLRTVDDIAAELVGPAGQLFLKVDAQGYELEVLRGAALLLERCTLVQLETLTSSRCTPERRPTSSSSSTCKGWDTRWWGWRPASLRASTGRVLQFDGVFSRAECRARSMGLGESADPPAHGQPGRSVPPMRS